VNRNECRKGDVEKRTGLLRCYISRVENGRTVPSIDTLEKMARAPEIPLYRLFTDDVHVKLSDTPTLGRKRRAVNPKEERELRSFAKLFSRMDDKKRALVFHIASKMANQR
jgi:transcriptional regulator with XRE-family HTH domain